MRPNKNARMWFLDLHLNDRGVFSSTPFEGINVVKVVEASAIDATNALLDEAVKALEYVARHKNGPDKLAPIHLDECTTVCEQMITKIKGFQK